MRGKEPRATLEEVRMGRRKKMFASSMHAQQELGFRIVPVYPRCARPLSGPDQWLHVLSLAEI